MQSHIISYHKHTVYCTVIQWSDSLNQILILKQNHFRMVRYDEPAGSESSPDVLEYQHVNDRNIIILNKLSLCR